MDVAPVAHRLRFDSEGRIHAEHWLALARVLMTPEFRLDAEFLDRLICNYFKIVRQVNLSFYRPTFREGDVCVSTPSGNNVLVFRHQPTAVTAQRGEAP